MKKKEIKKLLRENSIDLNELNNSSTVKRAVKTSNNDEKEEVEDSKIISLLKNDIINHAAVVRKLVGDEWSNNSEATNRSKFRKKLNKLSNDEGEGMYSFDEDEIGQIEKILMGLSSTITNSLGRQGK